MIPRWYRIAREAALTGLLCFSVYYLATNDAPNWVMVWGGIALMLRVAAIGARAVSGESPENLE